MGVKPPSRTSRSNFCLPGSLNFVGTIFCSPLEGSFQGLDKTLNQIENDATRLKHEVEQDRVTPNKAVVAKQGGDGLNFFSFFFFLHTPRQFQGFL